MGFDIKKLNLNYIFFLVSMVKQMKLFSVSMERIFSNIINNKFLYYKFKFIIKSLRFSIY